MGYDVALNFSGVLLFLQFKLSDCLVKRNAREAAELNVPYYRMHLRSLRHSEQHRLLLDLETSGELVFYATPIFHQPSELNDAYLGHNILERSLVVEPSAIGNFADDEEHYLAFNNLRDVLVCSKPKKIDKNLVESNHFMTKVNEKISKQSVISNSSEIQERLAQIIKIINSSKQRGFWKEIDTNKLLSDRPALIQIAYLARTFFDCETLIVKSRIN